MQSPHEYDLSTPLPCTGRDLVSYKYQSEARNYTSQIKGDNLSRAGNNANRIRDLSTPLLLDAILLTIDINWKLFTIDPKLKGTILNLFIKTGNDLSLAVNSKKFL